MSEARWQRLARQVAWLSLLAAVTCSQLFFWHDSHDPFAPIETAWIKAALPLGLLTFLLLQWPGFPALLSSWPARLVAGYVLWLWVSAFSSPFPADGLKTALEYSLYASLFFIPAFLDARQVRAVAFAFLTASLLATLYGAAQHFGVDPWLWSTDFTRRPLGTIGNPNFFGGHLILAFGLTLGLCLGAPARWRGPSRVALLLLALVLYWTRTVGVWLGAGFVLGLTWIFLMLPSNASWRQRIGFTQRGLLALAAGALLALTLWLVVALPGLRQEKSVSGINRRMMWKVALEHWQTQPLQGAGLATYRPLYPKIQADILAREPQAGWNYVVTWLPHQNFLYLLCETGLIGLSLFCGAWFLASLAAWRRAREGDVFALGALLGTFGMAGVSLLNTFSNIAPTALGFFLLLGVAAQPPRTRVEPSPMDPRHALGWGMALSLIFGIYAGRELTANRLWRQAGRSTTANDHASATRFLKKATSLNVDQFNNQAIVGAYFALGESLRAQGLLQEASQAYQQDLIANPHAPEIHNMLGASLGQLNLAVQAQEHLEQAVALSPSYASAMVNLGISYAVQGKFTQAAQAWTRALQLEPENREAAQYLVQIGKSPK